MSANILTLKVFGFARDHHDGGGSVTFYNSQDEALHDNFDDYDLGMTFEEYSKIVLNGEDPYEYGEIREATLSIDLSTGKLVEPFYASYGQ